MRVGAGEVPHALPPLPVIPAFAGMTGRGGKNRRKSMAAKIVRQNSLFAKTEPIFTTLFSIWILSEGLKTSQYLGMVLVIGSLMVHQFLSHRKKKAE
jgi:hypothetical protein